MSKLFSALVLTASMMMGGAAMAQQIPENVGRSAAPTESPLSAPLAVTHGNVDVASETGRSASPQENPLDQAVAVTRGRIDVATVGRPGDGA